MYAVVNHDKNLHAWKTEENFRFSPIFWINKDTRILTRESTRFLDLTTTPTSIPPVFNYIYKIPFVFLLRKYFLRENIFSRTW